MQQEERTTQTAQLMDSLSELIVHKDYGAVLAALSLTINQLIEHVPDNQVKSAVMDEAIQIVKNGQTSISFQHLN